MDTVEKIRLIGKGQPHAGITRYLQLSGIKLLLHDDIYFPNGDKGRVVAYGKNSKEIEVVPHAVNDLPTLDGSEEILLPIRLSSERLDERTIISELNVKPVLDRLIIKQSESKKEVAGMIIPESERQKPLTGTVVAAGPGFRNSKGEIVPMTAKVGDEVMYMEHSATKVEIDGVDYIYIKEGDLILIF